MAIFSHFIKICFYIVIYNSIISYSSNITSSTAVYNGPFNETSHSSCYLDAVILTVGKDSHVFEKSIVSSITHFLDIRNFYVIAPHAKELIEKYSKKSWYSDRIRIIGEDNFPFKMNNVSEIMIKSVKDRGIYPISGNSEFERFAYGRVGWFLQQLLKFYAGEVLGIDDYVLLDSDVIWFQDVRFISACNYSVKSFNYVSSRQYHPPYMHSLGFITGEGPIDTKIHRQEWC